MSYLQKLKRVEQTDPSSQSASPDPVDGRIIAVKICSHVLDACIWFSFDPDFKPDADEPLAVFYADELPFICDVTTERLKEIHQWKLTFGPGARVRQ
jgi:hypothetical protein